MLLSIVIPCYNEKNTLPELLRRIAEVDLGETRKEIIIVDDGSADGGREWLMSLKPESGYKVFFHENNQGKGSALRTGFNQATGDIVLVQDADLEYDPRDYSKLIRPIVEGECEVVFGSRERNPSNRTHSSILFYLGGKFLTGLTNLLYRSNLTDEATGYKVFARKALMAIPLECKRFEFCPEITAKLLRRGVKIREVPVSYAPRKIDEGKKIRYTDGLEAIWVLLKYRFKK